MDEVTRAFLEAMETRLISRMDATDSRIDATEARLTARMDATEAKLMARMDATDLRIDATDARLTARIDATEARLMTRMNDNHENLLERMRLNEMMQGTLAELARSTNMLLTTISNTLVDLARRVTDLENP